MNGTRMTIWVGQLGAHVLVQLLAGLLLLHRAAGGWWENLIVALLVVLALVKPTISVPFPDRAPPARSLASNGVRRNRVYRSYLTRGSPA